MILANQINYLKKIKRAMIFNKKKLLKKNEKKWNIDM